MRRLAAVIPVFLVLVLLQAVPAHAASDGPSEEEQLQHGYKNGISIDVDLGTEQLSGNEIEGCRANTKYVEYQNAFHQWIWRFYQRVEWCFNGQYVTSASATNWPTFSSNGAFWYYRGIVSNQDTPCGRGRFSCMRWRTALFELCFFKYGCISRRYPWHKHTVRADGKFTWYGGTN